MNVPVPSRTAIKFNRKALGEGTPIHYKYQENDHYFLALVRDYGPFFILISNAHVHLSIEVSEVQDGRCEIIPLLDNNKEEDIVQSCQVFDVERIPLGSIYIDPDGTAFMVTEVDQFYLQITDHLGKRYDIQAEVFFDLDKEEIGRSYLIYPPLYTEELIKRGAEYKERV